MKQEETDVLIVGAGPTGLMMACQLARWGIRFIILEKNSGPSEKSKALAIQARTLEIYDEMDIAERAIAEGHRTPAVTFVVKGKKVQRIPLSDIGKGMSPFPFLHVFEQNKNEKLLIDYLDKRNDHVRWNTELMTYREEGDSIVASVQSGGEAVE